MSELSAVTVHHMYVHIILTDIIVNSLLSREHGTLQNGTQDGIVSTPSKLSD